MTPLAAALRIASWIMGSYGPAKLILMMRAPLLMAHSMPAMICRVVASGDCRVSGREGVHREDAGVRRNAEQLAVRHDSAGSNW